MAFGRSRMLQKPSHGLHLGFGFLPFLFFNAVFEQTATSIEAVTIGAYFHTTQRHKELCLACDIEWSAKAAVEMPTGRFAFQQQIASLPLRQTAHSGCGMQAANNLTNRFRTIGDCMEIAAKVNQIGSTFRKGPRLLDFCIQPLQTLPDIGGHKSLLLDILLTPAYVLHTILTGIVELKLFALQAHGSRQCHCVPTIGTLLLILQQQLGRCHQPRTAKGCRHQSHKHARIVAASLQKHLIRGVSTQRFEAGACQHHLFYSSIAKSLIASAEGFVIALTPVLILGRSTLMQAGFQFLQSLLPVGIAQLVKGYCVTLVRSDEDAWLFTRHHEWR